MLLLNSSRTIERKLTSDKFRRSPSIQKFDLQCDRCGNPLIFLLLFYINGFVIVGIFRTDYSMMGGSWRRCTLISFYCDSLCFDLFCSKFSDFYFGRLWWCEYFFDAIRLEVYEIFYEGLSFILIKYPHLYGIFISFIKIRCLIDKINKSTGFPFEMIVLL